MKSNVYEEVIRLIKQSTMKAECQFFIESSNLFTRFTNECQWEEFLVHELYTELNLADFDIGWTSSNTRFDWKA